MSAHADLETPAPLDLSKWRKLPNWLIGIGGLGVLLGAAVPALREQFAFSWLLAFMFFLSLCLGGLFLVLMHHLFDAGWSVPIRRICEHLACLLPAMGILFLPVAALAPRIYPWMKLALEGRPDHALRAKLPLFTLPMFYAVAALCFGVWWLLSAGLRRWSLKQDETGSAECSYQMRLYSYWGIFAFAITLSLAAIMWMKALYHEWFSTMYGVYYFAGSVWMTLATVYLATAILKRQGPLREVVHQVQFYFIGSLLLAFTVFYAYIHFAQYFIIWNANMPEETFWYVIREKGTWWQIGMVIIFGHFAVPFLALLRIDVKLALPIMVPLCVWAWLMHFCDLSFNIMPILHPDNFVLHWLDLACLAFIGGVLSKLFLNALNRYPAYPQKDPRIAEALGVYVPPDQYVRPVAPSGGGER